MALPFRTWRVRLNAPHLSVVAVSNVWALTLGAGLGAIFMPSGWAWLAPLPLAWLFGQVARAGVRGACRLTFLFALAFFALHLAWLPVSFTRLFGPPGALPFAPLLVLLALTWSAAAGLTRLALGAGVRTLWALPFAWVALDWARGLGPLGFTWGSLGYALGPTPLAQVADLGGVPLLGLLVGLAASALAGLRTCRVCAAWVAGAWLLALGYGVWQAALPAPRAALRALLVQGNVNPLAKARGSAGDTLGLYERLTRAGLSRAPADIVVWPETAIGVPLAAPGVVDRLGALGVPLVLGAPTFGREAYFNSAYALSGGVRGRQDKRQLVPFGEFFPGRQTFAWLYEPLFSALGLAGLSGTTPGRSLAPLALGPVRAGVSICYESTFPGLARALVRRGANVLVTISNDAWFGRSAGAEQHFLMGRLRAIETRRFWLRAGNDGVTAVVDPWGRVLARFPRGESASYLAPFGVSGGLTPYVRFGDWPVLLSLVGLVALFSRRLYESRRVSSR